MKIYDMHLKSDSITAIVSGIKTIEIRIFDEKRKELSVGDKLIFTNSENENQKVNVIIEELITAPDFKTLFDKINLQDGGWDKKATPESAAIDMKKYYSKEQEKENGVLAIKFVK